MASIPKCIKRSSIAQFILCFVFVVSGLIVCTLQTFTIVLWPFSKNLYRIVNCKLAYLHWSELVFLCDYWAEVELNIHAVATDWNKVGKEHALLVMNHRGSMDFMVTWIIGDRAGILGNCKCLVMDWLRYIPLLGWSFVLLEFIFIKHDVDKNRQSVENGFKVYGNYPLNCVTLLFCEGSRFSEYYYEKCNIYAQKHGLEPLKHHLLPRTKGFAMAVGGLKKNAVPAMYDCCLGYDTDRGAEPTIENLLQGKKMVFHVLGRRVLIEDIPNATEKECADYCYDMYKNKDEEYGYFLEHKTFEGYDSERVHQVLPRRKTPLFIFLFWSILLVAPSLYYLLMILWNGSLWARILLPVVILIVYLLVRVSLWFSHIPKISLKNNKTMNIQNDQAKIK